MSLTKTKIKPMQPIIFRFHHINISTTKNTFRLLNPSQNTNRIQNHISKQRKMHKTYTNKQKTSIQQSPYLQKFILYPQYTSRLLSANKNIRKPMKSLQKNPHKYSQNNINKQSYGQIKQSEQNNKKICLRKRMKKIKKRSRNQGQGFDLGEILIKNQLQQCVDLNSDDLYEENKEIVNKLQEQQLIKMQNSRKVDKIKLQDIQTSNILKRENKIQSEQSSFLCSKIQDRINLQTLLQSKQYNISYKL